MLIHESTVTYQSRVGQAIVDHCQPLRISRAPLKRSSIIAEPLRISRAPVKRSSITANRYVSVARRSSDRRSPPTITYQSRAGQAIVNHRQPLRISRAPVKRSLIVAQPLRISRAPVKRLLIIAQPSRISRAPVKRSSISVSRVSGT